LFFSPLKMLTFGLRPGPENDMLAIDLTFIVIFLLVFWVLVLVLTRVFFKPVGPDPGETPRPVRVGDTRGGPQAGADAERDLRRVEESAQGKPRASSERLREELEAQALGEEGPGRRRGPGGRTGQDRAGQGRARGPGPAGSRVQLEDEAGRLADSIEKKVTH